MVEPYTYCCRVTRALQERHAPVEGMVALRTPHSTYIYATPYTCAHIPQPTSSKHDGAPAFSSSPPFNPFLVLSFPFLHTSPACRYAPRSASWPPPSPSCSPPSPPILCPRTRPSFVRPSCRLLFGRRTLVLGCLLRGISRGKNGPCFILVRRWVTAVPVLASVDEVVRGIFWAAWDVWGVGFHGLVWTVLGWCCG